METTKHAARRAGWWYLAMSIPAPFGLIYVPGRLIVRGDAAATAEHIRASETLFRLGSVSVLLSAFVFIFLVLALHRLLRSVGPRDAMLMVILVLVQTPIAFLDEANWFMAGALERGADFLDVFSQPQREALAMVFLRLHTQGTYITEIFWGLWLLPFGRLVFRSGFLPRWIGGWLIVNGIAYVVVALIGLLAPPLYNRAFSLAFPLMLGELATILWLLIVGARPLPLEPATPVYSSP